MNAARGSGVAFAGSRVRNTAFKSVCTVPRCARRMSKPPAAGAGPDFDICMASLEQKKIGGGGGGGEKKKKKKKRGGEKKKKKLLK